MTLANLILTCSDLREIVARFGRRPTYAEWGEAGLSDDSRDLLTPETCAPVPDWAQKVYDEEWKPSTVMLLQWGLLIDDCRTEVADLTDEATFRAQVRRFAATAITTRDLAQKIADLRAAMAAQAQAYRDMGAAIETMSAVVCEFLSEPITGKQPSAIVQARATLAQSNARAVLDAANERTQTAWWQAHDALAKMEAP